SEEGVPIGLCRADKLFYVTTAGGYYVPEEFGFGYVKALAQNYYGIQDVRKIEAVGLDIVGADVNAIMTDAENTLSGMDLT
ncbi:MAG: ACP phosphodiesterase, partial [Lachnospiraceae bacterium]|nr:ACP phosphodiesterase [Lachnospiraceae bacterium]